MAYLTTTVILVKYAGSINHYTGLFHKFRHMKAASCRNCFKKTFYYSKIRGYAVAQFVETQSYKPEVCGFNSRLCHWTSSLTLTFRTWCRLSLGENWIPRILPGFERVRCAGLTNCPPSCAACLDIWEPHPPVIGLLGYCCTALLEDSDLQSEASSLQ